MDEPVSTLPASRSVLARDWPWLIVLLVFVAGLRGWLLVNTEVTARDSIGFIRYSLAFDRMSWKDTLSSQHQHPGYPAMIWLVSKPMRAWLGSSPETMRISAQLVTMTAAVLLAFMMFRLGTFLWDRYIAFFASLLFQCLPISGHHLSDGISDGMFLLLAVTAIDALVRAQATGQLWRFAIGGAWIGLAYLTRPEGLLLLVAAWAFLFVLQLTRSTRTAWPRLAGALALLTTSCAVAGSPYYLATGAITIKPTARQILDEAKAGPTENGGWPLFASLFAVTYAPSPVYHVQLQRTLSALFFELCQAFHYGGMIFVVWAFVFCRSVVTRRAGWLLLALYVGIHAAILVKLGLTVSYVSDRHVMSMVALGCYPCVIGLTHAGSLALRMGRSAFEQGPAEPFAFSPRLQKWAAVGLSVAILFCAGKTVTRLHGNRVGNHAAGVWLASAVTPFDTIDDDHNWSHFYSGHIFLEGDNPEIPDSANPKHFVVMTRSRDADVKEKRIQREENLKKADARIVYHWPTTVEQDKARIVVYSMPRNYETHPWRKAPAPANVFQPVSREK